MLLLRLFLMYLTDRRQLKITVFSNPVQADTQLKIDLPANGKLQISLFDDHGKAGWGVRCGLPGKRQLPVFIELIL